MFRLGKFKSLLPQWLTLVTICVTFGQADAGCPPRVSRPEKEGSMSDGTVGRDARQTFAAVGGLFATVPIVLVGSLASAVVVGPSAALATPATTSGDTSTTPAHTLRHDQRVQVRTSGAFQTHEARTVGPAPASYLVVPGDTVSDIASRFGLATASVLAMNGLSWSSLIFPGQRLSLGPGAPAPVADHGTRGGNYTIATGDTISAIAARFGVSTLSVLSANGLGWSSIIYPGQSLAIPGRIGPGSAGESVVSPTESAEPTDPALNAIPSTTAATPPAQPEAPAEPAIPLARYTIVSGDTISAIAARRGISTQQLLDANGLDWSSMIYPGHQLLIPSSPDASSSVGVVALDGEMTDNAATIVRVGRDLGVSDYGIVIALAAAAQESGLRNLNWGDRDSVGLFQQRPSAGWGTVDELTTPRHAAQLFFGGATNPNAGATRGLLDIPGWENLSVTDAAQSVQISAYPDAYARWESSAWSWLAEVG